MTKAEQAYIERASDANLIFIEIPGVPVSKKRPRFFRRGNYVGTYNPQESEESKTMWHISQAMEGRKPLDVPLELMMTFFMPIPNSLPKCKRNVIESNPIHGKKPDIDNLIKHVLDAANGILFVDDRQIHSIRARKKYSNEPKTRIVVSW